MGRIIWPINGARKVEAGSEAATKRKQKENMVGVNIEDVNMVREEGEQGDIGSTVIAEACVDMRVCSRQPTSLPAEEVARWMQEAACKVETASTTSGMVRCEAGQTNKKQTRHREVVQDSVA